MIMMTRFYIFERSLLIRDTNITSHLKGSTQQTFWPEIKHARNVFICKSLNDAGSTSHYIGLCPIIPTMICE
jgi:hypothetical protein